MVRWSGEELILIVRATGCLSRTQHHFVENAGVRAQVKRMSSLLCGEDHSMLDALEMPLAHVLLECTIRRKLKGK